MSTLDAEQRLDWRRRGGYDRSLAREKEFVAFHKEADASGFVSCDDAEDTKSHWMPAAGGEFIDFANPG